MPSRSASAIQSATLIILIAVVLSGCAQSARQAGAYEGSDTYRSRQPPELAARCFARNAEEHSSALVAEVKPRDGATEVIVRVKNGVTYATAEFRRAGSGSVGSITLNVVSSGRRSDLLESLTEGC